MTTSSSFIPIPSLAKQTPEQLESRLASLIHECLSQRSTTKAGSIVQHIQTLCAHPDYRGTWEERCAYRRLARRWGHLAWVNADQEP